MVKTLIALNNFLTLSFLGCWLFSYTDPECEDDLPNFLFHVLQDLNLQKHLNHIVFIDTLIPEITLSIISIFL